jgi:hypothetical protein
MFLRRAEPGPPGGGRFVPVVLWGLMNISFGNDLGTKGSGYLLQEFRPLLPRVTRLPRVPLLRNVRSAAFSQAKSEGDRMKMTSFLVRRRSGVTFAPTNRPRICRPQ